MSLLAHGKNTLAAEVTNISSHGIWLFSQNKELFLSYEQFPWFKNQPVDAIINIEEPSSGHFYWPKIDIDLTQKMIEDPESYPLISK